MEKSTNRLLGASLTTLVAAACASSSGAKSDAGMQKGNMGLGQCHGVNACKSQGLVKKDQAECQAAGGTYK